MKRHIFTKKKMSILFFFYEQCMTEDSEIVSTKKNVKRDYLCFFSSLLEEDKIGKKVRQTNKEIKLNIE